MGLRIVRYAEIVLAAITAKCRDTIAVCVRSGGKDADRNKSSWPASSIRGLKLTVEANDERLTQRRKGIQRAGQLILIKTAYG
jgi:hypothetical protein